MCWTNRLTRCILLLISVPGFNGQGRAQDAGLLEATHFHLAPRTPVVEPITKKAMLDRLEGLCRFDVQWQDSSGAIIDPALKREFQYATPYFAYAVGVLVRAGRARELLPHGIAAMEHATAQFNGGAVAVPDGHGEFFLASLAEALDIYRSLTPDRQWEIWRDRLKTPIAEVVGPEHTNNWRTYAMKGEWERARLGLVPKTEAVAFVEHWWTTEQRMRFSEPPTSLYHDLSSDPDTLSVALVGEGNLLSLVLHGYDGPSAAEIRTKVLDSLTATLLIADPTGQMPANGRTDDHVWTDTGMQLAFSAAAPMLRSAGDSARADAMERVAALSFAGMQRWYRTNGIWKGSYYITKNHFDPALRVGYQNASQESNYTGSLMFHLAEMYEVRRGRKQMPLRQPGPVDVGGYVLQLDERFATAFANAGGLQLQINLRGETEERNSNWWTPLGLVRIARSGWDTRLGPADGAQTGSDALSFAPEFLENGRWIRPEQQPKRYGASWTVQTVNPSFVRATLEYRPIVGESGPAFREQIIVTPDGVLSTIEPIGTPPASWGTTLPLLTNDGRPLNTIIADRIAETGYAGASDHEDFLAVDPGAMMHAAGALVRSSFGDLLPVHVTGKGKSSSVFIYPRDKGEPSAQSVLATFRMNPDGFRSALGEVKGDVYIGRQFAGGHSRALDLRSQGGPLVQFAESCNFVARIQGGRIRALEVDRSTIAKIDGRAYRLGRYRVLTMSGKPKTRSLPR